MNEYYAADKHPVKESVLTKILKEILDLKSKRMGELASADKDSKDIDKHPRN